MVAPIRLLHESESFSTLFDQTHLIIFRYIYGLHGGPIEEVEDLTNETYIRAWKGRDMFSGEYPDAMRWLFTIARHLVIDTHRKNISRHEDTLQELDEAVLDSSFPSTHYSPEEQVIKRELFMKLWKLIEDLPVERREMLVLRYMIGWQVKQISDYLNLNENTVSVYIRRSLEQIRREWIGMGESV